MSLNGNLGKQVASTHENACAGWNTPLEITKHGMTSEQSYAEGSIGVVPTPWVRLGVS